MGKRSHGQFAKNVHDLYDTPYKAVPPLLPFLPPQTRFIAPCYGNGHLVEHLLANDMVCVGAYDIEPRFEHVAQADAREHQYDTTYAAMFIDNPPWTRRFESRRDSEGKIIWEEVLHPLILNLAEQMPAWLLFDADWAYTDQAGPLLPMCSHIVAVGRLKWIPGSKHQGKDNAAWYRFDAGHTTGPRFYGRGQPVENPVEDVDGQNNPPFPHDDPQDVHRENEANFERVQRELSPLSSALQPHHPYS